MSAWSGNGAVAVSFGTGLGVDDSGGIKVAVTKAGTDYAVLNLRLLLGRIQPGRMTADQLRGMSVEFSARGTGLLSLAPAIHPSYETPWSTRLSMPPVRLFERWNRVRLDFSSASSQALDAVLEAYNKGEKAELMLAIYLRDFVNWQVGDFFQIDDLVVVSAGR